MPDDTANSAPQTRIQRQKRELILNAALNIFAQYGLRGTTLDQIAQEAGLSKPNILYYFDGKEGIYRQLLERLLRNWLAPLEEMRADGDPIQELRGYILRKIEMARDYPRESRMFANEILHDAPVIRDVLRGPLKELVDRKTRVITGWMEQGALRKMDPYHLIFAIWATTQHYADFDTQVRAVLNDEGEGRFHDAAFFLDTLFIEALRPR